MTEARARRVPTSQAIAGRVNRSGVGTDVVTTATDLAGLAGLGLACRREDVG